MQRKVMILGGYGNFGKRIAEALTKDNIAVIIVGRQKHLADALLQDLPAGLAETASFDVTTGLSDALTRYRPAIVINTCGPFQMKDYHVAQCCMAHGIHYIDLADAREFVASIHRLDEEAKRQNVVVISGASTVPGLSSAVIEEFSQEFSSIESVTYGISPGQKAERGLATTTGILSYVGKPLKPFAGNSKPVYGWQDMYRQSYPLLGKRWMANCDIPDLDLFPARYNIRQLRFSAGLELAPLHLGLWCLSWLVRTGIPLPLPRLAKQMLAVSNWLNCFGSAHGGMHIIIKGDNHQGEAHSRTWFIIARDGYGPYIPTIPAVLLARKLLGNHVLPAGAYPCMGLVTLSEYLDALKYYPVEIQSDSASE